jgi:hypothetical protein
VNRRVFRAAVIAGALAALAAAPAALAQSPTLLMPGVTYERQVQFGSHGPVVTHVMVAPRRVGSTASARCWRTASFSGKEDRIGDGETGLRRGGRSRALNGDLFILDGRPSHRTGSPDGVALAQAVARPVEASASTPVATFASTG